MKRIQSLKIVSWWSASCIMHLIGRMMIHYSEPTSIFARYSNTINWLSVSNGKSRVLAIVLFHFIRARTPCMYIWHRTTPIGISTLFSTWIEMYHNNNNPLSTHTNVCLFSRQMLRAFNKPIDGCPFSTIPISTLMLGLNNWRWTCSFKWNARMMFSMIPTNARSMMSWEWKAWIPKDGK